MLCTKEMGAIFSVIFFLVYCEKSCRKHDTHPYTSSPPPFWLIPGRCTKELKWPKQSDSKHWILPHCAGSHIECTPLSLYKTWKNPPWFSCALEVNFLDAKIKTNRNLLLHSSKKLSLLSIVLLPPEVYTLQPPRHSSGTLRLVSAHW